MIDIIGKAGTGAVLSLDAIGLQDTYLTGKDDSFFQYHNVQHSAFTRYTSAQNYSNPDLTSPTWPFGQDIRFTMNPRTMGDLLSNMYIKLALPAGTYTSDYLGWAMIKSIEFRVDTQVIETVTGDWNVIYSELFLLNEERDALNQLFGTGTGGPLIIPLNFFFSRIHSTKDTNNPLIHDPVFKPYFLTCATLGAGEITVTVRFHECSHFSSASTLSSSIPVVTLLTDQIILSDNERSYIQNNPQSSIVSVTGNNPSQTVTPGGPFNCNLVANIPVKALYWFFKKTGFNFSTGDGTNETMTPIVAETQLYLNGQQLLGLSTSTASTTRLDGSFYYKFAQPLNHGLSTPTKNIYSYSFCLHPKSPVPSGSVNFSQMSSNQTKLTGSLYQAATGTYSLHVYWQGYHQLTYANGLVSMTFTS